MSFTQDPGACPICGAAHTACTATSGAVLVVQLPERDAAIARAAVDVADVARVLPPLVADVTQQTLPAGHVTSGTYAGSNPMMYGSASTPVHVASVLVTPPVLQPITLAEAKLRAGLTWLEGDERDQQMLGYVAAATAKVELDTGLALLTQTRDVYLDGMPGATVTLPPQCRPLQSITSVTATDSGGALVVLGAQQYHVDTATGRIGLALGVAWPSDVRGFQPWVIRVVAGWPSAALLPPLLVHAVGLLAAHYATTGRDLVTVGTIVATTPYGYDDAIAPHMQVTLA